MTGDERYDRQERLFGAEGQRRISSAHVAIVGVGGLGSHVVQQLAYLGTRTFTLVDDDHVTSSSLNRVVGATERDADRRASKVEVAARTIRSIQRGAAVDLHKSPLSAERASQSVAAADFVFGCVDAETPRLLLTEMSARNHMPYLDLATDVVTEGGLAYGGRLVFAVDGEGCLSCMGLLDQRLLSREAMTAQQQSADDRIYGISTGALDAAGPSVVALNGVVASLGVVEFMAWATGLRDPRRHLVYRGDLGRVTTNNDNPHSQCYYCKSLWVDNAP